MSKKFTRSIKKENEEKFVRNLVNILYIEDINRTRRNRVEKVLKDLVEEGSVDLEKLCPKFNSCDIIYIKLNKDPDLKERVRIMYDVLCSTPYCKSCRNYQKYK